MSRPSDAGGGEQCFGAGGDEAGRLELLSGRQWLWVVATADEFSRDGVLGQVEVGRDRDHGAPSDSSVSASGSGLGAA